MRLIRRHVIRAAAVTLGLLAGTSGAAGAGELIHIPVPLDVKLQGKLHPDRLPRNRPAPVGFRISAAFALTDGSPPPLMKALSVDFDLHGLINVEGIPACTRSQLEASNSKKSCAASKIGGGLAHVLLSSNPSAVVPISFGLFNGPRVRRRPTVLIRSAPTVAGPSIVIPVVIRSPSKGPYGVRSEASLQGVSGLSSILDLKIAVKRFASSHGVTRRYALARCANGHLGAQIQAEFADGARVSGIVRQGCKAVG